MSRKKHPEHVNHERWLVSYADFITLLFAFFVVLFASGQTDKRKQVKLAESMQSAFKFNGIFDPHSKQPALTPGTNSPDPSVPAPITLPLPGTQADALAQQHGPEQNQERLERSITRVIEDQIAAHKIAAESISTHTTAEGLVISLHEAGFFASGSSEVHPTSIPLLRQLAATLPTGTLRIEGHTDNIPIHTAQFATNWELSTARATTIARLLLDSAPINPASLSAAGYAEFHPIAPNTTPEGRTQNRRVDIILLKHTPGQ